MSDECKSQYSLVNFLGSYERIIILCFALISFIINLLITISIYLAKNNKISFVIKLSVSILLVNFINIFAYTFEWVVCKKEKKDVCENCYVIGLLFGNSNFNKTCQLQSFLILSSSMGQDYLMILFFYIVNRRIVIKELYINILIILSILFPIIISIVYLNIEAFGVNDDFCYLKKYEKNEKYENNDDIYITNASVSIFSIIIYCIRAINFSFTIYFLVNIIKYIKKENKSFTYIFKRLLIFFIQLFKLFIILIYRTSGLIFDLSSVREIYNILSTVDGVLMPLTYALSNRIFYNYLNCIKNRKYTDDKRDDDENLLPSSPCIPQKKKKKVEDVDKSNYLNKSNFIGTEVYNEINNFDLSF